MRTIEERNLIVEKNMGLVHDAIKHYVDSASIRGILSYEDLYQIGIIGLMAAAESFDTVKGVEFSTYAETTIRNHLYNACAKEMRFYKRNLQYEAEIKNESDLASYSEDFGELSASVKQALDEIKNNSKSWTVKGIEALELVIDGYSYTEIAKILDTTPENIKALIHRTRKLLKEEKAKFEFLKDPSITFA